MFGADDALGRCPKCGGDVIFGKFGAYCTERCGMSIGKAYGKELSEEQVKDVLNGKKRYLEGIKRKKGGEFNAYLIPDGIEEYSYKKKDGEEMTGYQIKFRMGFKNEADEDSFGFFDTSL